MSTTIHEPLHKKEIEATKDVEASSADTSQIAASHRTGNFRYAIRNIVHAAEELERAGREVLYLNIGDPQAFGFRPPAELSEAVARQMRQGFTGYSHSAGIKEARNAVAAYATALGGAETRAEDVLITSGASEAADLVLTALLNEADEVLLPAPGYPLYDAILNKLGAVARPYKLHAADGWQPRDEEVRSLINPRTRALLLINPNNPTGAITSDEATLELLSLAREHNLLVISDEVYRELCFEHAPTAASVLAHGTDTPLITLESLSKTHMLSGWRVGWMRFTNAERMKDLRQGIERLAGGRLCSPTNAQYAVKPALEASDRYTKEFLSIIKRRRDYAVERVARIPGWSCVTPQAAFYLMVHAGDATTTTTSQANNAQTDFSRSRDRNEEYVLELLRATGVLVVHGSGFGASPDENLFRLIYLADEATLARAFDLFEEFVQMRNQDD